MPAITVRLQTPEGAALIESSFNLPDGRRFKIDIFDDPFGVGVKMLRVIEEGITGATVYYTMDKVLEIVELAVLSEPGDSAKYYQLKTGMVL